MDHITSFLGQQGFLPHGYCFTWSPGLLWVMVASDAVIAASYFSIPLAILSLNRKRSIDQPWRWVPMLFSAFIFACGITHLMDIWTIWVPDYVLQAITKAVTAVLSVTTAIALWRLIPKALEIPSVGQFQSAIGALESEMQKGKSTQERLVAIEQSLAVTLASIDAGFISTDRSGRVVRMNAVAQRITGWLESEARGHTYWEVFKREGRPSDVESKNVVDLMIEQGLDIDASHRVVAISQSNERTPVEVKSALTYADDGSVLGLALVLRDMTRINSAEEAVRRLAAIVESSNDAIIGKTLDGRITNWNRAACTMFGYTEQEAIGQPVQMLLPLERQNEEMAILANLAQGKTVPPFDTVRLAKDGSRVSVSVTISPIHDAMGQIVGGSKIARDISPQLRTLAALRESEARLRIALEVAQIGDWELDLATGAIKHSDRYAHCFGYRQPQAGWSMASFLAHVHPDERDAVARSYRIALDSADDWHIECRIVWPDASVHWINVHGSTRNELGTQNRMLGVVIDVTGKELADQARIRALQLENENRQILESSRLKSQFLANMSHELRTPLNAIIGFSDLLYGGLVAVESSKHHEFIGHIRTSGRHLLQLINDVLDLSKVESGKFEFVPELVNLDQTVREVRDLLFTLIQHKRLHIEIDIEPALTDLVIDAARLKQVLYNYLSNAIKFTPDGGHVTVRAFRQGLKYFRLEVEDTGVGVAEADIPRLFVEFQQLDASYSKRYEGTGLGLALTRRLVEAQGGSVGVRSTLGQGSVFHIVLPLIAPTVTVDDPIMSAPAASDDASANHFLVIENDPHDQARIVRTLAASGFHVDAASNREQAMQLAARKGYDAFTLDLMLGDERGLDVLARIRSDGPNAKAPVVAMTLGVKFHGTAGFPIADVLSKPIRNQEVVAAMRRFGLTYRTDVKVMVIDDDQVALDLMQATLAEQGVQAVCLLDGRQALSDIEQHRPAAIILDLMMPEFDGFAVIDQLQQMPQWCNTPVFIWTSLILTDTEYALLARSARAILSKGGGGLEVLLERLRSWSPVTQPSEPLAND